eukprot:CAMPEP_0185727954 /NCGR_PEP_ID=MMETSP1171-20130828/3475_1 /TAXON_ID=374046 /ORGANISM="Helicotheca tamensis, Strain CCMP826" /LENGTH=454 /DNA_ID=CAMNT_0028396601 /DNA_START=99 /DNA_END=1463 /DNA_ORIENTATION=+
MPRHHRHHDGFIHGLVHGAVDDVSHVVDGAVDDASHVVDGVTHNREDEHQQKIHDQEKRLGIQNVHSEPDWVGQEIPGIGSPSRILQLYPQRVDDGHIKLMPLIMNDDNDESVKNLMFSLADLFDGFTKEVHDEILVEEKIKAAHTGAKVANCFTPSLLAGLAIGVATEVTTEVAKAKRESIFHEKAAKYSVGIAELISSANKDMKESAAAAGAPTYLSAALVEQSVSLNPAQAVALEEELDTRNTSNTIQEMEDGMHGSNRSTEEKVTNRFSVFEFCPVEDEEIVERIETEDLQYDILEEHFGQLKVVKKEGKTKILSTAVATLQSTAGMAFQPLKKKGETARAEVMNHRGLPAHGDFIIRRFLFLFRIPFQPKREPMKPLIHLAPVYTDMDPNDLDVPMSNLMYPMEVCLGPGEVPPHMLYDADRRLNQRRTKETYEIYDIKTGKTSTAKKG